MWVSVLDKATHFVQRNFLKGSNDKFVDLWELIRRDHFLVIGHVQPNCEKPWHSLIYVLRAVFERFDEILDRIVA